jgi:hypothetical protein
MISGDYGTPAISVMSRQFDICEFLAGVLGSNVCDPCRNNHFVWMLCSRDVITVFRLA